MAVALSVDKLDEVEQSLHGAYIQQLDGKYILDADRYAEIKAEGLKKKNRELLGKVKETQPIENRIAELEAEVSHYKLTTPLRKIIAESGVFPDMVDLVLLDTQKRFKLDDADQIVALDENGDPLGITPESFFQTLYLQQRPRMYKASDTGGGDARSGNKSRTGDGKTMTRAAFERMGQEQQMAFSLGGGQLID